MDDVNKNLRAVAGEEESNENVGLETPRSGVATPQPDLHDRRLPGIVTNFGQVGTNSPNSELSEADSSSRSLPPLDPRPLGSSDKASVGEAGMGSEHVRTRSASEASRLVIGESRKARVNPDLAENNGSCPPESRPLFIRHAVSDVSSLRTALSTSVVKTSPSTALHICNPETPTTMTVTSKPPLSRAASECVKTQQGWLGSLGKVLTKAFKSGPSTPTRALSQAQPSQAEEKNGTSASENGIISRSQTPRPSVSAAAAAGAQAPAAKGKLKIKIVEARGLRKARDPYVVVVFQRSELISGGPRAEDDEEDTNALPVHNMLGGVPIQRQGSDSGRPPMAIPMRSRQSSNTSVTDYNAFRSRASRKLYTDPKWDAEAVL